MNRECEHRGVAIGTIKGFGRSHGETLLWVTNNQLDADRILPVLADLQPSPTRNLRGRL